MSTIIKWGILGCGDVTEVKSGPAFNLIEGSELVAVMRRDGERAKDYAKRHQVPKWYDNAKDLISDPDVDAVYVATPPSSHAELTIRALKAGKPVYVEKPMAMNHSECQEMIRVSEANRVPLYVAYYRRAMSGFLKVKELVDSGLIGKVRLVNIQLYKSLQEAELLEEKPWRVLPDIAGGGHFVDLASHQLDYLDYVFGPAKEVVSVVKNQSGAYPAEDLVSSVFVFGDDVVVNGSWCFTVPEFLERDIIEIVGEKGSISFSSFSYTPITLQKGSTQEVFEFPKPEHVQQELLELVVDELHGKGTSPSTGITAARTSKIIDEVLEKYY